jgi:hypothetical protein
MSLGSDPLDLAFPAAPPAAKYAGGDPLDAAFPESDTPGKQVSQFKETTEGPLGFTNALAEIAGKSIASIPHAAAHGAVDLYRRVTGKDTSAPDPSAVEALRVPDLSENARAASSAISGLHLPGDEAVSPEEAANYTGSETGRKVRHAVAPYAADIAAMAPVAAPIAGRLGRALGPEADFGTAQEIVNRSTADQSMGAASATHNIDAVSPDMQQAIVTAARKTGGAVNPDVLRAHIEAEEHGLTGDAGLMRGQATRDPAQFTEEQNSTHPDVIARINKQNGRLTDALDNIRRDASPTTVGNDYIENGRAAVDALKKYDEPIQADIRAKYKALTDANGGNVPIDQGKFLGNVDAALKKGYLTRTAASTPEISEILDSVRSGEPMDFESYENARTRLAAAQRGGGSAGEAARIVRGELEQMPLSPEASKLKGLANTARSAAKARFDALEADPAYQAAVDDASAGNKAGSPSPLSDTFLDKYALSKSAPQSQVDLMMQKIRATDPDAAGAVASHALNAIKKSAVKPNGNIVPSGYNGALEKFGPKLDSLIEPETKDSLESFGRVLSNAKVEPAGGKVNYSRSGVIARDAIQSAMEHAANAKTGGLYGIAKNMLNTSENAFAKDALAPGAGLDQLKTKP